jgi:hypothetical protein
MKMHTTSSSSRSNASHQSAVFSAAAGLAVVLFAAGCTSHSPAAPANHQSSAATHVTSVTKKEMTGSRLIAQALADQSSARILPLLSYVAGSVLPSYIRMEALWDEVNAAAGAPGQPGSVASAAGGFQICYAQQGGCQSLTDFQWDSTGRITDFAVDGQLISPRLAVGGSYSGSALTFSSLYTYLETAYGEVTVVFEVRNTSGHVLGLAKQPAFLPVFVTASGSQVPYDPARYTITDGPIPPRAVTAGVAVFDTTALTGQFILRANAAKRQPLAAATVRRLMKA